MVIFDVDGTILDTSEGLLSAIRFTIQKNKLKQLTESELLTFIGPPVQDSFKKYYQLSEKEVQRLADDFRERYKTTDLLKATPYEGIYDLFQLLVNKNILVAIATYKRQDYALQLLEYFKFDSYTDIIYGGDNLNKLKKKDIIAKCLERADNIEKKDVLVIGDSKSDGVGAYDNGCDFCCATYGFGIKIHDDITDLKHVKSVNNVKEIIDWIETD